MTKYISEINDKAISEVAGAIRQGKVVVFKTDTVYGIGANAFDEKACERVYEIKRRPKRKPLVVLIAEESMLKSVAEAASPVERELMEAFWPGALTIFLRKKRGVLAKSVALNTDYVGFRLVGEGVSRDLIKGAGVPVVAPSANLSGSPTGVAMQQIRAELEGKVDYILDEGDVKDETTSTIVQVEDGEVVIIREGRISREEIAKIAPLKK